jgi:hypothetical protein
MHEAHAMGFKYRQGSADYLLNLTIIKDFQWRIWIGEASEG